MRGHLMKKLVLTVLSASALISAQAQLISPEAWNGAFWGSLIGGVAGSGHHHGFSGQGAAIGAAAGLLLGGAAELAARRHEGQPAAVHTVATAIPAAPATPARWGRVAPAHYYQIPDAPRVPDAPTF